MTTETASGPRLTHVSLVAEDVEESADFYEHVLGCERIPTPHFGNQEDFETDESIDFQMVRLGDLQLHLWNDPGQEIEALRLAHIGIHVGDFERVYREAEKRDVFASIGKATASPRVFDFNGTAQMYLRDPTGNLIEVDHPDIDALDRSVFADVVTRDTRGPNLGVYSESLLESISHP